MVTRRTALGMIAAPLLAGCRGLDMTGPRFSLDELTDRVTLFGAGDVHAVTGYNRKYREQTAALMKKFLADNPRSLAFNAGDLSHEGTALLIESAYAPTWGQFKDRTIFCFGNHDGMSEKGQPYYDYTNLAPYYARTLGRWRFYVLNTEGAEKGGADYLEQLEWLRKDLEEYSATHHIFAMHHYPHHSNDCAHLARPKPMTMPWKTGPWWDALIEHNCEFALSGHVHRYERFQRMLRNGSASSRGIRQFVLGTGGGNLYGVDRMHPTCQKAVVSRGIMRLDLSADSYAWSFTDLDGVVKDSGTQSCRKVLA